MKPNRRNFLRQAALGAAGLAAAPMISKASSASFANASFSDGGEPALQLGVAGYTFFKYSLEDMIKIMKRLNVLNLSLKEGHLPLNSTDEKIAEVTGKLRQEGINIYAVGVIYMKSKEEVDRAFAYAKKVGVTLIVGAPNPELLPYCEQKVKEYDFRLAIHNHGPEDKLYPSPADVYGRIKDMDRRMGLCMDIGHATRAGADIDKIAREYKVRLFDLHVKDVRPDAGVPIAKAKVLEVGRGVIDHPALVRTLEKTGYKGMFTLEYEKDMTDIIPGFAESIGYLKGVIRTA